MGDDDSPYIKISRENSMERDCIPVGYILVKFVDEQHLAKVLSGSLKMGSVKKFINEYKGEEGLRNDPNELLDFRYNINPESGYTACLVDSENQVIVDFQNEVKQRKCLEHRSYLFCMSAIKSNMFSEGNTWRFDPRVKKLGDKAIIVNRSREFFNRIDLALGKRNFLQSYPGTQRKASGFVQYEDFSSYSGAIGPFIKSKEYEFHNEWRLALVDSRNEVENHKDQLFLEIGDLKDIAFAADTDDLIHHGFILE